MKSVYCATQFILPPGRFAVVKREQIEWLKKRDAASSIGEKCKPMEARIEALQALVLVMLVELDLCSLLL
jgi:hypothetical protein